MRLPKLAAESHSVLPYGIQGYGDVALPAAPSQTLPQSLHAPHTAGVERMLQEPKQSLSPKAAVAGISTGQGPRCSWCMLTCCCPACGHHPGITPHGASHHVHPRQHHTSVSPRLLQHLLAHGYVSAHMPSAQLTPLLYTPSVTHTMGLRARGAHLTQPSCCSRAPSPPRAHTTSPPSLLHADSPNTVPCSWVSRLPEPWSRKKEQGSSSWTGR